VAVNDNFYRLNYPAAFDESGIGGFSYSAFVNSSGPPVNKNYGFSTQEQTPRHSPLSNILKMGAFGAAVYGAGKYALPMQIGKTGKTGFDYLNNLVTYAEEMSPMYLGRTFRGSEYLSQFTSRASATSRFVPMSSITGDVTSSILSSVGSSNYEKQLKYTPSAGEKHIWKDILVGKGEKFGSLEDITKHYRSKYTTTADEAFGVYFKAGGAGQKGTLQFGIFNFKTGRLSKELDTIAEGVRIAEKRVAGTGFFGVGEALAKTLGFGGKAFTNVNLPGAPWAYGGAPYWLEKEGGTSVKYRNPFVVLKDRKAFVSTFFTEQLERFNRLAKSPVDFFPGLSKILGPQGLGVKSGPPGMIALRIVGKAVGLAAAHTGYQQWDWWRAQQEAGPVAMVGGAVGGAAVGLLAGGLLQLPWKTVKYGSVGLAALGALGGMTSMFNSGYSSGVGDALGGLSITYSKLLSPLKPYRDWQESKAPGSTDILKLAGFPLEFGLVGAMYGGIKRQAQLARFMADNSIAGADKAAEKIAQWEWQQNKSFYERFKDTPIIGKILGEPKKVTLTDQELEILRGTKTLSGGTLADQVKIIEGNKVIRYGSRVAGMAKIGALVGAALVLPFLPGALLPSKTAEEKEAVYSGEEWVPVKRGRWWLFGRNAFEGDYNQYYRPHMLAILRHRPDEQTLYGDDSPVTRWYKKNFTYDYQIEHYWDRPYPYVGGAFSDVPIIGGVLSATIGQVFRPSAYMHQEDWGGPGGAGGTGGALMEYGGQMGVPIEPGNLGYQLDETLNKVEDVVGLTGFMAQTIQERITGSQQFMNDSLIMDDSNRMTSSVGNFWRWDFGDPGTTEFIRRFYTSERNVDRYNPIENSQPQWMPGEEYHKNFKTGDPYKKVNWGDAVLPGGGYESFFPELQGVDPEDYPTVYRYHILANVAASSEQFKYYRGEVKKLRTRQLLSDRELEVADIADKMANDRYESEFYPLSGSMSSAVSQFMSQQAYEITNSTSAERNARKGSLFGWYWKTLYDVAETPAMFATPLSPLSKFTHTRTSIEEYERFNVWGSQNAFWGHPVRDFLSPTVTAMRHAFGMNDRPDDVKEKDRINEYFDKLKYEKYQALSTASKEIGDLEASKRYYAMAKESVTGLNPYEPMAKYQAFRAIAPEEKKYFNEFASATDEADRKRIIRAVPKQMRDFYRARWEVADAQAIQMGIENGSIKDVQGAQDFIQKVQLKADLYNKYSRGQTDEYFAQNSLPSPSFVGFHPAVDLDDVKLKFVEEQGYDHHQFSLWDKRARSLPYKPVVNNMAMDEIMKSSDGRSPTQLVREMKDYLFNAEGISGANVKLLSSRSPSGNSVDINIGRAYNRARHDSRDEARNRTARMVSSF